MRQLNGEMKALQKSMQASFSSSWIPLLGNVLADIVASETIRKTGDALAAGNKAVFDDIYWQYLAYSADGIAGLRQLNKAGELSNSDLVAWELINSGNANKISMGNLLFFLHEQQDILQPYFDMIPEYAAKLAAESSLPLFPGATRFGAIGDNIAVFAKRWGVWISKNLWPEWNTYLKDHLKAALTQVGGLIDPNR